MVRPDKVAVVEEIGEKLSASTAAVLTEYRGLSVPDLADLRSALRQAGTQYKVYKNTLARRAVEGEYEELIELLEGPVAWAFIDGDVVTAAKAIRDFSKDNDKLVVKGGLLDGAFISADQVDELAQLPTRDELLGKLANGFQAPLRRAAGLFSALQRNTAYAVKALIDQRVEAGEEAPPADDAPDEAAGDEPGEASADAAEAAPAEAPEAEAEETSAEQDDNEASADEDASEAPPAEDSEDDSGEAEASTEAADDAEASEDEETSADASQPEDEAASAEGDDAGSDADEKSE